MRSIASMSVGVSALIAAGWPVSAPQAADLPSEGSFKATLFASDKMDKLAELPAGDGIYAWSFVENLTYINDAGHGFLHEVNGRCIGMGDGNQAARRNRGHCAYVDADGDAIFTTFENAGSDDPVVMRGTKAYTGGTGKYAGLTGSATFTAVKLKKLDDDAPDTYEGHAEGSYQIKPGGMATSAAP